MDDQDFQPKGPKGGGGRSSRGRQARRGRRLLFVLLLSAGVLATEAALIYYNTVFSSPVYNTTPKVDTEWVRGDLIVLKVLDPAVAAGGLRTGDRILGVTDSAGRYYPLRGPFDQAVIARALHYGEPFEVRVLRHGPDGRPRAVVATYPPIPESARLAVTGRLVGMAPDLLLFVACLAAALLIGIARPEEETAFAASLLFLCFASLTWHGNTALFPPAFRDACYGFWILLYACVTAALLWFCLRFPSPSPIDARLPWLKRAGVAFGLTFAVWNGIIGYLTQFDSAIGGQYLRSVRYADWTLDVVFCLLAVAGLGALVLNLRSAQSQDERRRLSILLCGILGLFPWLLTYLYRVVLGGTSPVWFQVFVVLAMIWFPLSFLYVVLRHRVFGIRVILRRGVKFALLSRGFLVLEGGAIFAAFYYAAGPPIARVAGQSRGGVMAVAVAGLTLATVIGIRKVNGKVLAPIERRFFREAYDAHRILTNLTVDLRRLVGDSDALVAAVVGAVSDTLHPRDTAVFLRADALAGLPFSRERQPVVRRAAADVLPRSFLCFWRRSLAADLSGAAFPAEPIPLRLSGESVVVAMFSSATSAPASVSLDPKDRLSGAHVLAERGAAEEEALFLRELRTRLLVPLSVGSEVLGFVALGEKLSEEPYSREDEELLFALAQQMADTLDHARLLHQSEEQAQLRREVEIAQQVQQNLLPRTPVPVAGLDYAASCIPARYVGGDYYDFIRRGESGVGLALGDISGKGVSAALLMASIQATLREQADAHGDDVAAVMAGVNRRLCDSAAEGRFATLFYGLFDTSRGTLDYANAGHNPPMLFRPGQEGAGPLRLEPTGTVIGIFPEQRYERRQLALRQGDVLVVFSDGVTEAMSETGEFFEEERLAALVPPLRDLPAAQVRDRILEDVARFAGSAPQADDITLIVARVL